MRILVIAAALVPLVSSPALAQPSAAKMLGGRSATDPKKPKVDEKAYKEALERIPEPKEKYDPWGVARPAAAGPAKPK